MGDVRLAAPARLGGFRNPDETLEPRAQLGIEREIGPFATLLPHEQPCLVLDPITARQFVDRGGFDTKEKLIKWVHETATMPAGEYWDYQLIQNYVYPRATYGEEPYATKLKAREDELIPMFTEDEIEVTVVGGETNGYWRIFGARYAKTVSVDEWR